MVVSGDVAVAMSPPCVFFRFCDGLDFAGVVLPETHYIEKFDIFDLQTFKIE